MVLKRISNSGTSFSGGGVERVEGTIMMAEERQLHLFEKNEQKKICFRFPAVTFSFSPSPVGVFHSESRVLCGKSLSCTRFWCLGKRK